MKLMEETLATHEKKRKAEDRDIDMRPAKRPRLVTEGRVQELLVGDNAEDGTFALVESVRDPLVPVVTGTQHCQASHLQTNQQRDTWRSAIGCWLKHYHRPW